MSSTGEKEVPPGSTTGEEVNSPRRLSGDEASQRRHFGKAFELKEKEVEEAIKKLQDDHNSLVEQKRAELEPKDLPTEAQNEILNKDAELLASVKNLQATLVELLNKKHELEVTELVKTTIQKYFKEFGDKIGFSDADDQVVEELNEVLK